MPARDQRLLLGAALATSALLLLATLAGHADLLPYAAPLFLIAVPLLAGRYVGEERLERMRSGLRRAPLRAPRTEAPPALRRVVAFLPRGGRLIAHSLAERPPPRRLTGTRGRLSCLVGSISPKGRTVASVRLPRCAAPHS